MTDVIGWASSIILLLTLVQQVYKQWVEGTSEGISKWLFVGQVVASVGFTIYSYQVGSWVFMVTNALLIVNNFIGLGLSIYFRKNNNES